MPQTQIKNFEGGLSLLDPTEIKDNQFERLRNFFYDRSKRVQTRRGYVKFGDNPDNKPITSYFFYERDDGGGKIALRVSGNNIYKYDETTDTWVSIYASVTEFEPSDPSARTRWSFDVYKNIIYGCNGVNDYLSITVPAGVVTAHPSLPKVRYVAYLNETMFGFGEDSNPITLYYSYPNPSDGLSFDDNSVVIGGDQQGKGTGVFVYNQVILASKEKKIYTVDIATPSALPIDTQNGLYSARALSGFGNGTIYFNDLGINLLTTRQGVEGGGAFIGDSLSEDVQPALEEIRPKYYNSNCGYFIAELANYYFSFDTTNEDTPDKTLVLSRRTKAWSEYTIPPAYQYGEYITDNRELKYITASALEGQMYEIENGFSDDGVGIDYDLLTKQWDFNQPSLWKDFEAVDIYGTKNEGSEITVEIIIDGETVCEATIDDDNIDITDTAYPIGVKPIGLYPIGGGGSATIDTFSYQIRIPVLAYGGGNRIQVRMSSSQENVVWTLDKMTLTWQGNTFDMFDYNRIG